jgi:hypothetical protein
VLSSDNNELKNSNIDEKFNPLLYKKFLYSNIIEFSRSGFQIDFRELLINNMSFGNPIGCLMLCEAVLKEDSNYFSSTDLSELYLYLILFGVINDSINPVVKRGLFVVFNKVKEDVTSGKYFEDKGLGISCIFDGIIRSEFWLTSLYELHISVGDSEDLVYQTLYHYVLKYSSYSQSSRLLRRVIRWGYQCKNKKPLEFLYILQSVNFLDHLNRALDDENENESDILEVLKNQTGATFGKQIFDSIIFFVRNFLLKILKDKKEKEVVEFLAKKEFDIGAFSGKDLESGILLLFRNILKNLSKKKDSENEDDKKISKLLISGKQKIIEEVMKIVNHMVTSQLETSK